MNYRLFFGIIIFMLPIFIACGFLKSFIFLSDSFKEYFRDILLSLFWYILVVMLILGVFIIG